MFAIKFATSWIVQKILLSVVVLEKMAFKVKAKVSRSVAVAPWWIFVNILLRRLVMTLSHIKENICYRFFYKIGHVRNFDISISFQENDVQSESKSLKECCSCSSPTFCIYFHNAALYDLFIYKKILAIKFYTR